jgi:hypothetical protein
MQLLNAFATELDAVQWIKNEGKTVVIELEYDLEEPVILCIDFVTDNNMENGMYSDNLCSTAQCNPAFAFSKVAYDIMLAEHMAQCDWRESLNPFWVNHIDDQCVMKRGCDKEWLHLILDFVEKYTKSRLVVDAQVKDEDLHALEEANTRMKEKWWCEFEEAQIDLDAWVIKKRKEEFDDGDGELGQEGFYFY